MKQYLILLKGEKELDYSSEALQSRIDEYRTWVEGIGPHFAGGQRLEKKGVHFKNQGGLQTDGPFLEAKEIIAGYIIINADSLGEATELTKSLPLLKYFDVLLHPLCKPDV